MELLDMAYLGNVSWTVDFQCRSVLLYAIALRALFSALFVPLYGSSSTSMAVNAPARLVGTHIGNHYFMDHCPKWRTTGD